jgi:hypothetical protein
MSHLAATEPIDSCLMIDYEETAPMATTSPVKPERLVKKGRTVGRKSNDQSRQ